MSAAETPKERAMWECNSKKFRSDASAASPVDRLAGGMTADEHWDVQRYVLEDPTLDRSAFEVRLLADPRLAEAVAACVRQVQESPASAGSYASASHLRRRWLGSGGVPSAIAPGLVGLASVVLLALGWIAWRSGGGHAPREAGAMGGEMSAVAESWLAMMGVTGSNRRWCIEW